MTTLLQVTSGNSEGSQTRRCDAKCYNAAGPDCDCICAGINHGKGLDVARNNTVQLAESWIDAYNAAHPEATFVSADRVTPQLSMEMGL